MKYPVYLYIAVMAIVTYLIRMLPLTLIKKEIKNPFIRSFLYYVPYVTLAVMTFPAILTSTQTMWSGLIALIGAVILAWKGGNLFQVAVIKERACSRFPFQPVPSCLSWSFSYNIIALTWKICHWQVLTSE